MRLGLSIKMFDPIKCFFDSASVPARETVQCETKALETPTCSSTNQRCDPRGSPCPYS